MNGLVAFLCALVTAIAGLSAQSQLTVDTLLPIGRVVGVRNPVVVPEYSGSRRPWIYIVTRDYGDTLRVEFCTWRFQTLDDTVRVRENRRPLRVMLDANGDGRRDFYDSLLVLSSDTGWVEDTVTRFMKGIAVAAVADVDADGNDDLICRERPGMRVYWGDSVEPLRSYSSILNPEGTYSNQVAPAAICVVNRLQGIPAIATFYDIDDRSDHGRRRWFSGWRLDPTDVAEHRDTIAVLNKLWSLVFFSETYEPEPPTLLRNGRWLSLGYDDWIAFDSTGTKNEYYAYNQDTLILSGSSLAGSTMLPLSHPPTLDSMLQLTISHGSVLSVRKWLSPEQIIPVETKAYYLQPQTIATSRVDGLFVWPDMTGDSIPELAVIRKPNSTPFVMDDFCFEIYDIAGAPESSTIVPFPVHDSSGIDVVHGRIVWKSATGADISVRVYDAAGRLLLQSAIPVDTASTEGIRIDPQVGKGLRLVELTDAAGRIRRTTILVR